MRSLSEGCLLEKGAREGFSLERICSHTKTSYGAYGVAYWLILSMHIHSNRADGERSSGDDQAPSIAARYPLDTIQYGNHPKTEPNGHKASSIVRSLFNSREFRRIPIHR